MTGTKWEKNISVVEFELFSFRVKALIGWGERGIREIDKAKLLLEAKFFIIIFTYLQSRYTGSKWSRSTWQPSSIHFRHGTSLLRLHGHFGPVYLHQVSKNDDEVSKF